MAVCDVALGRVQRLSSHPVVAEPHAFVAGGMGATPCRGTLQTQTLRRG